MTDIPELNARLPIISELCDLLYHEDSQGGPHLFAQHYLEEVAEKAYVASMESEEGRQLQFNIALWAGPHLSHFLFLEPRPLTSGELVKLAPTVCHSKRALIVSVVNDNLMIGGIWDHELHMLQDYPPEPNGSYNTRIAHTAVQVLGPGRIRLGDGIRMVELQGLESREIRTLARVPEFMERITTLAEANAGHQYCLLKHLCNLLQSISDKRHGGTVVWLPDPYPPNLECLAKFKFKAETARTLLTDALFKSCASQTTGLDGLHERHVYGMQQTLALELVSGLTEVDGALFLDSELKTIGFGAEIKYAPRRDPPPVLDVLTEEQFDMELFGMRNRSACWLCAEIPGTMAFVVSQDGQVRLYHGKGDSISLHSDLSAELVYDARQYLSG